MYHLSFILIWACFCLFVVAQQEESSEGPQTHILQLEATCQHNPKGRRIIALNGRQDTFGASIRVRAGDSVHLSLENHICSREEENQGQDDELWQSYCETALHFHGLVPIGNDVDGIPGVTQEPIKRGEIYWYNFTIPPDVCGTFWYHSHSAVQYGDGLRGAFVVECDEYSSLVNRVVQVLQDGPVENGPLSLPPRAQSSQQGRIHEEIITLSDWYHDWNLDIERNMVLSPGGTTDPHLDGSLINGFEEDQIKLSMENDAEAVVIRVINAGMAGTQILNVEGRRMVIIETDGVLVKPYAVETLSLAVGQRYTAVVFTGAKGGPLKIINGCNKMMGYITKVFWITKLDQLEENQNFNGRVKELPGFYSGELFQELEPLHGKGLWGAHHDGDDGIQRITLEYEYVRDEATMQQYNTGMYKVNGMTLAEYMRSPIEVGGGKTVEIVINSLDHMRHPWHLHGHQFQLVSLGQRSDGPLILEESSTSRAKEKYEKDLLYWQENGKTPMTRDSINIAGRSFAVLRILADRPGDWLLHCHVEWHVAKGLGVMLRELPPSEETQQSAPVDQGISPAVKTSKLKVLSIYLLIMTLIDGALYYLIM